MIDEATIRIRIGDSVGVIDSEVAGDTMTTRTTEGIVTAIRQAER